MSTFADAQPYVTGAVHFAIKPRKGEVSYLGTSEFSPSLEIDKAYIPLFNDLGGPVVPFDLCYVGKQAFVAADLTRFNPDTVATLMADPTFHTDDLSTALIDEDHDVGTLIDTEDVALELFMVFPYQTVSAYASMYRGFHFLCCCAPKVIFNRLGTQPKKIHFSAQCIRAWDSDTKKFVLADETIDEALGVI
jgi:hypothetical protein